MTTQNKIATYLAFLGAFGVAVAQSSAAPDRGVAQVAGLQSKSEGATTKLTIRTTSTPTFTVYKLDHPARVVVDLVGNSLAPKLRRGDNKTVWNLNTWSVSQVSANDMAKAEANVVRFVVGLSRDSRYEVRSQGKNVVVEVTAKTAPPQQAIPMVSNREADLAREAARRQTEQEREAARRQAEKELQIAREDARRIREQAKKEGNEARKQLDAAEKLMALAKAERARAQADQEAARSQIEAARAREEKAQSEEAGVRARIRQDQSELLAAKKKLKAERSDIARMQAKLDAREQAAARAQREAESAANDKDVSAKEVARLRAEAQRLAKARDRGAEKLAAQEAALDQHARRSAELEKRSKANAESLENLKKSIAAAKSQRAAEEKRLAVLSKKRSELESDLRNGASMQEKAQRELAKARAERSLASKAREQAEAELLAAKSDREQAAAKARAERSLASKAREQAEAELLAAKSDRRQAAANAEQSKAERAEVAKTLEDARAELERAKRERLLAEKERRDVASQTEQAQARERAAQAKLAESQAARQEARSGSKAELRKAKAMERKAQEALRQAKAEREAANRARLEGEKALRLAAERERQASEKLRQEAPRQVVKTNTSLRDLDVVSKPESSRVVIAMSSPAKPRIVSNRGTEAVLEIPAAALRDEQERTLDTQKLRGVIKAVSSFRDPADPSTIKVVVDLKEPAKGVLKKVGNTYYWDFPAAKAPVRTASAPRSTPSRTTQYKSRAVAGYGSASSPINQQTVAQSRRRRKAYRGMKIDLDFKNGDIHDLMRMLAEVGGVNIIIPDDISGRVTIRLQQIPWDEALDVILASKGLGYKQEGPKLYRVATQKELDEEFEAKLEKAKAIANAEPPEPEKVNLNYIEASKAQIILQGMLSQKGTLQIDQRSNAIIVNDVAANRRRIIDMARRLDTQTPQVKIEARIVEARTTFARQFGIQWGGNAEASAAGGNATGLIFPSSIGLAGAADDNQTPTGGLGVAPSNFAVNLPAVIGTGSGGGIGLSLGSVGGNLGLNLRLSALEDEGSVRIISQPNVTTSNNIEASIKSGVSIPISVVSANGVQTQFVPADLLLKVTPSVSLQDCAVSMKIELTKNEADFVNTGARGDPTLLTKEVKTQILVQDGDTTVIGGIYTRNSGTAFSKVPFFGDLPVIGWLFKTNRENDERTEVLVFITPKITNRDFLPCTN